MNRIATIQVGQIWSSVYEIGARPVVGFSHSIKRSRKTRMARRRLVMTGQGSVISPLLFNIVIKGLSDRLGGIPGIGHALYADDITIWYPGGSLAEIEQALQAALGETGAYLADKGLKLSSNKSELLVYRPARLTPLNQLPVVLYANNGQKTSKVDSIKILGMLIDPRDCNVRTITYVTVKTDNMLRLVARVSNRKRG